MRDEAHERPDVAVVGRLEVRVVVGSPLDRDDDRRVAGLHQDQVHQQSARAAVAVVERVNVNEPVVRERRHLDRVKAESFLGVQPVDKLADQTLHAAGIRRNVVCYKYLHTTGQLSLLPSADGK